MPDCAHRGMTVRLLRSGAGDVDSVAGPSSRAGRCMSCWLGLRKQVDILIARWDRGPELRISTKAQLSRFGKNLPNRFEESHGDATNLRGRYSLVSTGHTVMCP